MTQKILGPGGSKRRKRFWLAPMLAALFAVVFYVAGAQAVHDTGRFQLDGDAVSGTQPIGPAAADDWDKVCHQVTITDDPGHAITDECPSVGNTTNATAVSWTAEPDTNSTIFTGGGSKDPIDISDWAWKDGAGGLPDKDNLLHGFAARYSLPDDPVDVAGGSGNTANGTACPAGGNATCEILVFGSDRFDNSGDAQQGFWFFQNRITLDSVKSGGGFKFKGVHKNGDLLIISDFSNGGTTSTITVYVWDNTVSGNLKQLETSDAAKCSNSLAAGDAFCGIVNPISGAVAPWSFTDKSGFHTFLNGEFYEGGVNLSLLPGAIASECFASIASETRSSTSTTATLKDFVLGNFGNCTAGMTTSVHASSVPYGTQNYDVATVTGSSPAKTPTGNVTFFLCSFDTGTTDACDDSDSAHHGTQLGSPVALGGSGAIATAQSPNTSATALPGRYCFRAEWPGDSNYAVNPSPLKEYSVATECFTVTKLASTTTTNVHNAAHSNITNTSVIQGTVIHDKAFVTPTVVGGPIPTGSATFTLYSTIDCSGPARTATPPPNPETVGLDASGNAESTSWTPAAGAYSYKASYGGSTIYDASTDSVCEPITIINPSTTLNKTASVSTTVTYGIVETNDGSVPLTLPTAGVKTSLVEDNQCSTITYVSGDTGADNVFGAGEIWTFSCQKTYTGAGTFTNIAKGHGIDTTSKDVTVCADVNNPPAGVRCDQDETDTTSVTVSIDQGK